MSNIELISPNFKNQDTIWLSDQTRVPAVKSLTATKTRKSQTLGSSAIGEQNVKKIKSSLAEQLFDNSAKLKLEYAKISRYLDAGWRQSIFKQIDRLLSPLLWENESSLINEKTFNTLLRFLTYSTPTRMPSLGVSTNGHILAAWYQSNIRVNLEFLENDKAIASCAIRTERFGQTIIWRGHVAELKKFLERNQADGCVGI